MRRTLSSGLSGFYKFFPALWIPLFGLGTAGVFLNIFHDADGANPPAFVKWIFLCVWLAGSVFSYHLCASLKEVSVDEGFLYVSNYLDEVSVPLSEIGNVSENRWLNIHPVTIHLKSPTKFGSRIKFMPKVKPSSTFGTHPVVTELEDLAKLAGMQS
jgi:hypothetical protein